MLKFHVDLHSTDPEDGSQDVKFHVIVDAEDSDSAKEKAIAAMQSESPALTPEPDWEWSIYEFPLG